MYKSRLVLTLVGTIASVACATSGQGTNANFSDDAATDDAAIGEAGPVGTGADSSLPPQSDASEVDDSPSLIDEASSSDEASASSSSGSGSGGGSGSGSGSGSGGGSGSGSGSGSPGGSGGDGGVTGMGVVVDYQVQNSNPMSAYIGSELSITNNGTASIALSGLEARYYFIGEDTDGVDVTPQMTINWGHVSTTGADADLAVTSTFNPYSPATATADTYVAFDFSSSHSMLAPGEAAVFSWQMQGPNPATDIYNQTTDYSFNASLTSLASWSNVPLFQSGTLLWGAAP